MIENDGLSKKIFYKVLFVSCLFSLFVFGVFYKDIPIEKTYICQKNIHSQNQLSESAMIKVNGTYKRNFLKEDYLILKLNVDSELYPDSKDKMILPFQTMVKIYNSHKGYQFTEADTAFGNVQVLDNGNLSVLLRYSYIIPESYPSDGEINHGIVGTVVFSRDFSKITIYLSDSNESFISGETVDEALSNDESLNK